MPLTWSLEDIEDHENKCWLGDDSMKDEERGMNPVTRQLINITMVVGLNKITKNNYDEFFTRIRMYETCFGPFLYSQGKNGVKLPHYITRECIFDHVGLKTNAGLLKSTDYHKVIMRRLRRECSIADIKSDVTLN